MAEQEKDGDDYASIERRLRSTDVDEQSHGLDQLEKRLANDIPGWIDACQLLVQLGIRTEECDPEIIRRDVMACLRRRRKRHGAFVFGTDLRSYLQETVERQIIEGKAKQLILSSSAEDRERASGLLYGQFQEPVWRFLTRLRSRGRNTSSFAEFLNASLQPEDLADIWQETMQSIWRYVISGKFKYQGSLFALLTTTAWWRTVDWWRAERRKGYGEAAAGPLFEPAACPQADLEIPLLVKVELFSESLSERNQLLLRLDMELLVINNFERVSAEELAEAFNSGLKRRGKPAVRVATIQKRRQRIWGKLQDFLGRQEHDD